MGKKTKERRSLEEILQPTSDVLFPAELGRKIVTIDSRDVMGDSPLHVTVWQKDRYGVDLLIETGADIDAVGDMGVTPLQAAVTKKDIHIIESLLKAGARTDIRSEFWTTAREEATQMGGVIGKLFKQYGAKKLGHKGDGNS